MDDFNKSLEFHKKQHEEEIMREDFLKRKLWEKMQEKERKRNRIKFHGQKNYANATRKAKGNLR